MRLRANGGTCWYRLRLSVRQEIAGNLAKRTNGAGEADLVGTAKVNRRLPEPVCESGSLSRNRLEVGRIVDTESKGPKPDR